MIRCQCLNRYKDDIFVLTRNNNDLLAYHKLNNYIEYVGSIKKKALYCCSCSHGNKIYYFPFKDKIMCIYDIHEKKTKYIELPLNHTIGDVEWVRVAFPFEDDVVVIVNGCYGSRIAAINTKTNKLRTILKYTTVVHKTHEIPLFIKCFNNPCINNSSLWLPLNLEDIILRVDLSLGRYDLCKLPHMGLQYYTVNNGSQGHLLLTGKEKLLLSWNYANGHVDILNDFPQGFTYRNNVNGWESSLFYAGYNMGAAVVYAPLSANMAVKFDIEKKTIEPLAIDMDKQYCCHAFYYDNRSLYLETDYIDTLKGVNAYRIFSNGAFERFGFDRDKIPEIKHDIIADRLCPSNNVPLVTEDDIWSLKFYINIISKS